MSIPFLFPPESPVTEKLVSLTDILSLKSGLEQRVGLRYAPRQELTYNYLLNEVLERPIVENMLFTAQQQTFSVPMWFNIAYVSSPITAGDTTLNTDNRFSDFRPGNKLLIRNQDGSVFETLTISSVPTHSTLLTGAAAKNWPIGSQMIALQDCLIGSVVKSSRSPVGLVSYTIEWKVIDSTIDRATPTTDPTYGTLGIGVDATVPVADDPNEIDNVLQESNDMSITMIDGNTGIFSSLTYQAMARRGSVKSWHVNGPYAL